MKTYQGWRAFVFYALEDKVIAAKKLSDACRVAHLKWRFKQNTYYTVDLERERVWPLSFMAVTPGKELIPVTVLEVIKAVLEQRKTLAGCIDAVGGTIRGACEDTGPIIVSETGLATRL